MALLFNVLLNTLLCFPGLYLLHLFLTSLIELRKNYQAATSIGLDGGARPILVPVYEVNFLYKLTLPLHEPIIRFFGLAESPYWQLFFMDWCFKTRHDQFKLRRTGIITTVSPLRIVLTTADAEVAYQLGGRFEKPVQLYSRINFMGENVASCEGAQWRRLAKILRRPFNEAVMSTVWQATLDQVIPVRQKWCDSEGGVIVGDDIPKMALGVMCGVGFGVTVPFESQGEQRLLPGDEFFASSTPPQGFHFNFGGALHHLLSDIVTVLATKLLFPAWLLTHGPVPRKWKEGALSLQETRTYIQKLVERERQRNEAGYYAQNAHRSNILTTLTNSESSGGLTEDEQIANTFILGLAGHETVAGTLRYSLVLLALFEDKQRWFLEELDKALAGLGYDDWTYEKLFPRLLPCLCIMHETLRLFPAIPVVPRWCPTQTTLKYNGKILHIPAGTMLNISLPALQQNPKYFGEKAYEFRPEIWDARSATGWTEETSNQPIDEAMSLPYRYIRKPVPGSYMPFSEGRRACLGKKWSQVEFCLTLAVLFEKHRVRLVFRPGEDVEAAKERCWGVLRGSLSLVTLQMQEPVPLKWVRR